MQRITLLLTTLFLSLCAPFALRAEAFIPQASTDDVVYEYYIKCSGGNEGFYVSTAVGSSDNSLQFATDGNSVFTQTGDPSSALKVKLVASTDDGYSGCYKIYATNLSSDNGMTLIGCSGTGNGATVTYYATDGTGASNTNWDVAVGSWNGKRPIEGYKPYYTITLHGSSSKGWNTYGDASIVKLYNNDDNNSQWTFFPANEAALKAAAATMSAYAPAGFKMSDSSVTAAVAAVEAATEYSFADAVSLMAAYSSACANAGSYTVDLEAGYYYIVNKATDRYEYLFNDDFYASNTNQYTLLSNSQIATNNGLWRVSANGNVLSVTNGQGTGVKASGLNTTTLEVQSELTDDGYYYFTEGINCTESDHACGDYRYIVTWTAGGSGKADNRWKLERADVAESSVYTVSITSPDGVEGYVTNYMTGEYAYDGGFFIIDDINSAFLYAPDVSGYSATVTVEGHTVNVAYRVNYASATQEFLTSATAALNTRGVGYPVEGCATYNALRTVIYDAEALCGEGYVSEADYTAFCETLAAYKATTDNIQMPESGKAYTFTAVLKDGRKRLMYFDASAQTYYMTTAEAEPAYDDAQKLSAVLVCRDLGDGKYAFVNNAGNFFIWRGGGDFADGYNDNSGYLAAYDTENYACDLSVEKLTADGHANVSATQDELFGYMTVSGLRNSTADGGSAYFVGAENSYYGAAEPYYNDTYSSALLIEEVDYPSVATLNYTFGTVKGANYIIMYSAPYATVIPDGVKAYYASDAETDGEPVAKTVELTGTVPAYTGVILTSDTESEAVMVPVTTEEVATVETNVFGNTAGSELAVAADNTQIFVLSSGTDGIGFYRSAAATLPMNSAYLNYTGSADAITLDLTGTSAGIDGVTADEADAAANAPLYDLSGRRVMKAVKGGVYIRGGKKWIMNGGAF